jgi:predicted MFS family arabinose efflux permease
MTIYASDVLRVGAGGLGLLLSAVGSGAVVGSMLLLSVFSGVRQVGRVFIGAGLVCAAALVIFAFSRNFAVSFAAAFVMGLCQAAWGALGNTIVQLAAPSQLRGRVLSVHVLVTRAFDYVSGFQSGLLIGLFSPVPAVLMGSVVMAAALVGVGLRVRSLRTFRLPARGKETVAS